MLVSQGHREHHRYIAYPSYMEAEEFQAPAVLLSYVTAVAVTVHVTEFLMSRFPTVCSLPVGN